MLVLHGSWLNPGGAPPRFYLWGEDAGAGTPPRRAASRQHPGRPSRGARGAVAAPHPFSARTEALQAALAGSDGVPGDVGAEPAEVLVRLPSGPVGPLPSPDLRADGSPAGVPPALAAWRVEALGLSALRTAELLMRLSGEVDGADLVLGADLRYWVAASRFALALLHRQRVMPTARRTAEGCRARWEPLLDEAGDAERLDALVQAMPPACRGLALAADAPEPAPRALVRGYVAAVADALAREALRGATLARPGAKGRSARADGGSAGEAWLVALQGDGALRAPADDVQRWYEQYRGWAEPSGLATTAGQPFRLCLRLDPPALGSSPAGSGAPRRNAARDWTLAFALQATDDPSLLVPAAEVWRQRGTTARLVRRRFEQPQERLLGWLGRAARLFPPIEAGLRTATPEAARLTTSEAHEFFREKAVLLQANGFGVLVPGLEMGLGVRVRLGRSRSRSSGSSGPAAFGRDALVDFDWALALGDEELSRAEFEALARLKEPLVQVRGRWVELRPEQLEQALAFFQEHGHGGQMPLLDALGLALAPDGEQGLPIVGVSSEGWVDEVLSDLRDGAPRVELAEPAGFVGELRRYQRVGLSWLAALQRHGLGACLADDMGLGKTVQVIALLLHGRDAETGGRPSNGRRGKRAARAGPAHAGVNGGNGAAGRGAPVREPALLICPTSVVGNWQRELARFAPTLRVLVHHGADRDREGLAELAGQHDVVISTYALLHRDETALAGVTWRAVILDEAQNIKNAATRAAQAARRLPTRWRAALTGTPVENRLADLWSISQFLNPGYLGSAESFRRRFAGPIERGGDAATAARLKALVGPFLLRRVKTDRSVIADLPEKNEMKVFCTLTREQATLYQAVVHTALVDIEESDGIERRGRVLSTLTKLKQLCDHPALYLHDAGRLAGRSGKLARLTEMLDEVLAVGERALVFTQYAEMGKLLKTHLESAFGREALFLHGGTAASARDRQVERFQEEPHGPQVFILSLKAGGTGLNLTRANHVFHFDRWWNPAVEDQATDRAFRIGQRRDVQVHKLICAGTFEETIDALIERKVALAQAVVGTSEAWLTELGNDELRELLALRADAVGDE